MRNAVQLLYTCSHYNIYNNWYDTCTRITIYLFKYLVVFNKQVNKLLLNVLYEHTKREQRRLRNACTAVLSSMRLAGYDELSEKSITSHGILLNRTRRDVEKEREIESERERKDAVASIDVRLQLKSEYNYRTVQYTYTHTYTHVHTRVIIVVWTLIPVHFLADALSVTNIIPFLWALNNIDHVYSMFIRKYDKKKYVHHLWFARKVVKVVLTTIHITCQ